MHFFRAFGFTLLICALCVFSINAKTDDKTNNSPKTGTTTRQQQLVESVDIQGNRRLKDDDLLYYIKTRPGDVFNQQQLADHRNSPKRRGQRPDHTRQNKLPKHAD